MTDINPEHHDQSRNLNGNPFADPATPLNTCIRLERWDGDNTVEIRRVDFDARLVFDAEEVGSIGSDSSDLDWVFHCATTFGLVDDHDGPFTVEVPEELAEYIAHRENNAMISPSHRARTLLLAARVEWLTAQLNETLAHAECLRGSIADAKLIDKAASDLVVGDVLVMLDDRVTVKRVNPSPAVPGMVFIGTMFGALHAKDDFMLRCEPSTEGNGADNG